MINNTHNASKNTVLKESYFTRLLYMEGVRTNITNFLPSSNQYALAKTCKEIYRKILRAQLENISTISYNWLNSTSIDTRNALRPLFETKLRCYEEITDQNTDNKG